MYTGAVDTVFICIHVRLLAINDNSVYKYIYTCILVQLGAVDTVFICIHVRLLATYDNSVYKYIYTCILVQLTQFSYVYT